MNTFNHTLITLVWVKKFCTLIIVVGVLSWAYEYCHEYTLIILSRVLYWAYINPILIIVAGVLSRAYINCTLVILFRILSGAYINYSSRSTSFMFCQGHSLTLVFCVLIYLEHLNTFSLFPFPYVTVYFEDIHSLVGIC